MNTFEISGNTFRLKKMNAIELFALRTFLDFEDFNKIVAAYSNILERIEVQIKDQWLPVKQGQMYFPRGIEEDIDAIPQLIKKFMEYVSSVFTKSEE